MTVLVLGRKSSWVYYLACQKVGLDLVIGLTGGTPHQLVTVAVASQKPLPSLCIPLQSSRAIGCFETKGFHN